MGSNLRVNTVICLYLLLLDLCRFVKAFLGVSNKGSVDTSLFTLTLNSFLTVSYNYPNLAWCDYFQSS